MATLMNGDPTNGKQGRKLGRPRGSKDSQPRQRPVPRPKTDDE